VEDHGVGMSATFMREKLFKPFSSTKENGFGIGAFEARTLIAAMGGRIEVSSREADGSRFSIILPRPREAAQPILPTEALAA
jgi:signal transduction histidine kinase